MRVSIVLNSFICTNDQPFLDETILLGKSFHNINQDRCLLEYRKEGTSVNRAIDGVGSTDRIYHFYDETICLENQFDVDIHKMD